MFKMAFLVRIRPAGRRSSWAFLLGLVILASLSLASLSLTTRAQAEGAAPVARPAITVQATPNDGQDDTSGVLQAIARCRESGAGRLVFQPGRYDFFDGANPKNPHVSMPFDEIRNLDIDGQGAEFIFHGLTSPMQFTKCENINVRNFSIDWDRPPFSVGKVVAAEPKSFDVEVFDEFPVKGGEPVGAFMDHDPETKLQRRPAIDAYDAVSSTALIRPQVLRVALKREIKLEPGVLVVLRHQVYGPTGIYLGRCHNMRVENVTVYAVPGMSLIGDHSENITLDHYRVLNKPGTQRLMSATADATHFGGCTGLIRMKDCVFEGMGDDAVNIKSGLYLSVIERKDERTIMGEHSLKMASPPDPGEMMEICHLDTMLPYATRVVKSVELLHPDAANPQNTVHKIEFTEPLPADMKIGDVFGNASRLAQVHISGCRVHANRPRGFLIQSRNVLIEDNTFDACAASGVLVITEVAWFNESISAQNVIIRNNLFKDANLSLPHEGAITVVCYLKGFGYPPLPGVFKNITIEGNTIDGTAQSGIFVSNTENLVIRNNQITGACQRPTHATGGSAIALVACRNALITGNQVDPKKQGVAFKMPLELGTGCEKESIAVRENVGF